MLINEQSLHKLVHAYLHQNATQSYIRAYLSVSFRSADVIG